MGRIGIGHATAKRLFIAAGDNSAQQSDCGGDESLVFQNGLNFHGNMVFVSLINSEFFLVLAIVWGIRCPIENLHSSTSLAAGQRRYCPVA